MNQMMGSASTSMSTIMEGDKVNISPPNAELLTLNSDAITNLNLDSDETIVKVAFNLSIGDLIDSEIVQLMPLDFAKELAEYLIGPKDSEADTTTEGQTAATNESAQAASEGVQQQAKGNQSKQAEIQANQTNQTAQQRQQQMEASKSGAVNREGSVDVQSVEFSQLNDAQAGEMQNNISLIRDVPLEVTVRLGKTKMLIKDILELGNGSVIELDKLAGESVDLLVNGKLIAKGEVVVIDENFGFRVTDIVSPMERINSF
jgi:flagellar motor switch protein FliN/FliY